MKTPILLSLVAMAVSACGSEPKRVACVGDSITYGSGIKQRETKSYPAQLGGMLGEDYVVKNFGVSGATALKKGDKPYWKRKQFKAAHAFKPDIVVIKLGTNDTKPHNWKHGAEFAADYRAMVEGFKALPSKPEVYLCLPIPVFKTRWGITDEAVNKDVIPAVRGVAKATGAKLIDLNTPMKGKSDLVPDSVHPNAAGATIIAETVASALGAEVPR